MQYSMSDLVPVAPAVEWQRAPEVLLTSDPEAYVHVNEAIEDVEFSSP